MQNPLLGMQQPEPPLLAERGLMPLPKEFQGKPVYYLHTPCIKGISCGYYTLNNAIQLERRLQGKIAESVEEFINTCTRATGRNLLDSTTYEQRRYVSDKYSMAPILQLKVIKGHLLGNSVELSPDYVRVANPKGEHFLGKLGIEDWSKAQASFLDGVYDVIHFMGELEVQNTAHVILLSVVRHADGSPGLYVFDNCNVSPAEHKIMYTFINYLLNNFIIPALSYSAHSISGAIENGNLKLLKYLLRKPEAVAALRDPKSTYLLDAFKNYISFETINLLLSNNIFIPHQGVFDLATRGFACTEDKGKDIIKLLLKAGADPFVQEEGPSGISYVQKLLKESALTRREPPCLQLLENYFTDTQRAKLEELRKSYQPGFSIKKLIEMGKISPEYRRNKDLNFMHKDINSLEGLQEFELKDAYKSISFAVNHIIEIPKDIFDGFDKLIKLDFEGNKIKSIDPLAFSHLKYLQELNLNYNELSYLDPELIRNIVANNRSLTLLDVSNNKLSTQNIETIQKLLPPTIKFEFRNQKEEAKPAAAKVIENPALQLEATKRAPLKLAPLAKPAPAVKK